MLWVFIYNFLLILHILCMNLVIISICLIWVRTIKDTVINLVQRWVLPLFYPKKSNLRKKNLFKEPNDTDKLTLCIVLLKFFLKRTKYSDICTRRLRVSICVLTVPNHINSYGLLNTTCNLLQKNVILSTCVWQWYGSFINWPIKQLWL